MEDWQIRPNRLSLSTDRQYRSRIFPAWTARLVHNPTFYLLPNPASIAEGGNRASPMASQQHSIKTAARNSSSELPFDLNESSISTWLENLPITDKIETCKTVFSTLQNLNRHTFDSKMRFKILELFRTVVFLESSHLETHLTGAAFPLEQKIRKIAKLAAKFHSELASGYQLITNNSEFEEIYSNHEKATVIHRIFQSIGISILRIAQMYEPPSSRVWHLLKKLYLDAESKRLLDIRVRDPLASFPDSSTIAEIFGRTILFSVCNPYQYSPKEMHRLFKLFDEHRGNIEWGMAHRDQNCSIFGIGLENALAPQHGSSLTEIQNRSLRGIDVSKFVATISRSGTTQDPQVSVLNETALETLVHHLGSPKKVKINSLGIDTELTLGLEKITELLHLDVTKPTGKNELPTADWLPTPNFELLPLSENQGGELSGQVGFTDQFANQKALAVAPPAVRAENIWKNSKQCEIGSNNIHCEVHRCDLPNHVLVELRVDNLMIGQIVALKDNRSPMQIGVIRWVQPTAENHYFYYGIERLTSKCSLANIFISSKKHTNVLLLEKNTNGFSRYGIVMPPTKYRSGTRLTVKQPQLTKNFILEKLLETSTFFCHYSLVEYNGTPSR